MAVASVQLAALGLWDTFLVFTFLVFILGSVPFSELM